MARNPHSTVPFNSGARGEHQWLTTSEYDLDGLLTLCPAVTFGKYLAVTSFDSGPLSLNELEKKRGWYSRGEIAYSPQIQSLEVLPPRGGFDEWYVFEQSVDLGHLGDRANIFEAPLTPGQVETFVNFCDGCALHRPNDLTDLFWRQLEWIRPESYVADGDNLLTFVTTNENLFSLVSKALREANC